MLKLGELTEQEANPQNPINPVKKRIGCFFVLFVCFVGKEVGVIRKPPAARHVGTN